MYKPINGFTKAKILEVLKARPLNGPAMGHEGIGCTYLAANGNKCAVGMFIPDGHRGQEYEGFVTGLLGLYPDLKSVMPLVVEGLATLQMCHDQETGVLDTYGREYTPQFKGNAKAAMIDWVEKNVQDDAA